MTPKRTGHRPARREATWPRRHTLCFTPGEQRILCLVLVECVPCREPPLWCVNIYIYCGVCVCVCASDESPLFCGPSNTKGVSLSRRLMAHRMQAVRPAVEFIASIGLMERGHPFSARSPIFKHETGLAPPTSSSAATLHAPGYVTTHRGCHTCAR